MAIIDFSIITGEVENVAYVIAIFIMSIYGMCQMNNEVWNQQIFFHIGIYAPYLQQKLGTQHVPELKLYFYNK